MLNEVKELQDKAVSELLEKVRKQNVVTFKAPTGSGKTHMMADFMDRMLGENKGLVFVVSSLSKASLAKQNYDSFVKYIDDGKFRNLNPFLISSEDSTEGSLYIPTDYNVYVLPRDLYKEKSKLKGGAALVRFLNEIIGMGGLESKQIYLIKDECHQETSNLDELIKSYFSKVINFSATPNIKKRQIPDVILRESDAVRTHLIKRVEYGDETDTLEDALERFVKVRNEYHNRSIGVSPCMIIQISNKEKADEEVVRIKETLNKEGFSTLKWMLILDNSEKKSETNDSLETKKLPMSKWKYFAKLDSSTIDIIIFKMVISEGWDIRRACMLYQVRDTKSKILDEQVIGRVRRNPRLLDFEKLDSESQELVTTAWVWGLREKEDGKEFRQTSLFGDETNNPIQNEIKIETTRLMPFDTVKNVDIDSLDLKPIDKLAPPSIFDLYRNIISSNTEVQDHYNKWVDSYDKFYTFGNNIKEIKKAINNVCCDYAKYMARTTKDNGTVCRVSFPYHSSYVPTEFDKDVDSWVWRQKGDDDEFSFDSVAEKEWIKVLLKLKKKGLVKTVSIGDEDVALIGKNFLDNSEIKYEYYDGGRRFSYPDFVMKDAKDRIHIFEVKSLNISFKQEFDPEAYREKAETLKEYYKAVSKVTNHFYYLPVKHEDEWHIWMMRGGEVREMTVGDFEEELRG